MADLKNPFGSFSDYQSGRQTVVKPNDFINDASNELVSRINTAFNGNTAELRDPVKYRQTSIMAIIMLVIFWPAGLCLILRRRRQWLVSNKLALVIMSWVLFSTFMIFFILPTFVYETNNDDEQHVIDQQADKLRQEHDYLINVDQPLADERLVVDCNLRITGPSVSVMGFRRYPGENDQLMCSPAVITGQYSPAGQTTLIGDSIYGSVEQGVNNSGQYTIMVEPTKSLHAYTWEQSELNYDDIQLTYGNNPVDVRIELSDQSLPGVIAYRDLEVEFRLTDADKQLLEQYHQRYLQYQQLRSDNEAR